MPRLRQHTLDLAEQTNMVTKVLNSIVPLWAKMPSFLRDFYYKINLGCSLGTLLLPDRFEIAEVKSGICKGMKIKLNPRRDRQYYFGVYENHIQSTLMKLIQQGMTAFNLGANYGFFTMALSRLVGPEGFVVAFEPNPNVLDVLLENIRINNLGGYIKVEEIAISDFDGHAKFSLSLNDARGRFEDLPDVKPGFDIQVTCRRLDTYIMENNFCPDFILMDVEYAEGRVLRGMSRTLKELKPVIIIEMHGPASIQESWLELEKHNYVIAKIPEFTMVNRLDEMERGSYITAHSHYMDSIASKQLLCE